jgi:small subunit ribosomal protein S2
MSKTATTNPLVDEMFQHGTHYGFIKSRRHPSVKPLIFGIKNNVELFDLEKTSEHFSKALEFVKTLGVDKKTILFVSSKFEAMQAIEKAGKDLNMPYVAGRFVGGTITNFVEIKKRIDKLADLKSQRERGELSKYTKKERLLIDREIARLEKFFGGISNLTKVPNAIFVVDPRKERVVINEAKQMHIPVVALAGTDCDISEVEYSIPANDSSKKSIEYVVKKIVEAYQA